jgi:hypothetical protein
MHRAAEDRLLEELAASGATLRQIAEELGVGYSTVRYRLNRLGLTTVRAARTVQFREAMRRGLTQVEAWCPTHGRTRFFRRTEGGFRCGRCNSRAVAARRRTVKMALVAEAGGACSICGYNRHPGALQFHHRVRSHKTFGISQRGFSRSMEAARAEAAKCVLLCANCHAEVEAGVSSIPDAPAATVRPEFGPG